MDELTDLQLEIVSQHLKKYCIGEKCISRLVLYDNVKSFLDPQLTDYKFEQIISEYIKSGKLQGFTTRLGKKGGICRAGAFTERDNKKLEKKYCNVSIGGKIYKVKLKKELLTFVTCVLGGQTSIGRGQLHINNSNFRLPTQAKPVDILENFVKVILNGKQIEQGPK